MINENFIGQYNSSVDQDTCKGLIALFENANKRKLVKAGLSGSDTVNVKKKDSADFSDTQMIKALQDKYGHVIKKYFDSLIACHEQYKQKFPILNSPKTWPHGVFNWQLQRYYPGGQAYHAWHYEAPTPQVSDRILAWMTYLNDVDEGGETEFQYYDLKIKPEQGKTLIWPAGFTHVHRGLPAPRDTKYIITNWFRYVPESMLMRR